MPNTAKHSFNPNFSKELDIESLISAPLVAVSKANAVMAQGQTRFLLEYCFNKVEDNYEPVLIKMALTKSVIVPEVPAVPAVPATIGVPEVPEVPAVPQSIQVVTSYFNLPLLTIMPLNSLTVEKVSIDFHMEISSAVSGDSTTANGSKNTITDKKTKLYGRISHAPEGSDDAKQNKSKASSKIIVKLEAATLPLPSGVLTIIDLYTKAIHAVPAEPTTNYKN